MKIVNLHGKIAERFGARWELEVDSIIEALRAIDANTGDFFDYLSRNRQENKTFSFILDGCSQKIERKEELLVSLPRQCKEFHVIPNAEGAGGPAFIVQLVFMLGTAALMRSLFKPPKPEEEKQSKSFLFAGAENVTSQSIPVPLGYGKLLVGSIVVSSTMRHVDRFRVDSSDATSDTGSRHFRLFPMNISKYQDECENQSSLESRDPFGVFSLDKDSGGGPDT